jgi:hypothetical protein
MIARLNRQTALRAQDLADADRGGDLMSDLGKAISRFWTCYVWRQGVREGELGFLIALMAGLDAVLSGMRARELIKARALAAASAPIQPTRIGRAG